MTNYVLDLLPRIKAAHPDLPILEFVQEAGDTVFVPGGWWHGVLNLDNTVAITQNYCSRANFDQVWRKTRIGRKKMSVSWLRRLHESVPDLAQRAVKMNEEDGFVMYDMNKRRAEKQARLDKEKEKERGKEQKRKEDQSGSGDEETKTTSDNHDNNHHTHNQDNNHDNHDNKKKSRKDKKRKDKDELPHREDDTSPTTTTTTNNNNHSHSHNHSTAQQGVNTALVDGSNEHTRREMKKMRVQ